MRERKPFRPTVIERRPELSGPVPRGGMLLIDAIVKKIVRAGLVRSMMEPDEPFCFGLLGACHDEGQILAGRQPIVGGPTPKLFYLIR